MSIDARKNKAYDPEVYAGNYSRDMDFEEHLILSRHECCKRFLMDKKPASVLEIGCGPSLLLDQMDLQFDFIDTWSLVEPSLTYAQPAIDKFAGGTPFGARFHCEVGYFEEVLHNSPNLIENRFDVVLLSGLIHETSDPQLMLSSALAALVDGGWCYILVPNALSYHRLLAAKMGLIEDPASITERNILLGQNVVYSPATLEELIKSVNGFANFELRGHTLKLFTNAQMADIIKRNGPELVPALDRLGQDFPANAAEIAMIVQKTAK